MSTSCVLPQKSFPWKENLQWSVLFTLIFLLYLAPIFTHYSIGVFFPIFLSYFPFNDLKTKQELYCQPISILSQNNGSYQDEISFLRTTWFEDFRSCIHLTTTDKYKPTDNSYCCRHPILSNYSFKKKHHLTMPVP